MVRHAFQAELYGLTATQRNQTVTQVNNALSGRQVVESSTVAIRTRRGDTYVLIECTFATQGDGDAIFDVARTRAQAVNAGTGALSLAPSYVRMRSVDDVERTITTRYAETPGWVESTVVDPLDSARLG